MGAGVLSTFNQEGTSPLIELNIFHLNFSKRPICDSHEYHRFRYHATRFESPRKTLQQIEGKAGLVIWQINAICRSAPPVFHSRQAKYKKTPARLNKFDTLQASQPGKLL